MFNEDDGDVVRLRIEGLLTVEFSQKGRVLNLSGSLEDSSVDPIFSGIVRGCEGATVRF